MQWLFKDDFVQVLDVGGFIASWYEGGGQRLQFTAFSRPVPSKTMSVVAQVLFNFQYNCINNLKRVRVSRDRGEFRVSLGLAVSRCGSRTLGNG